MSQPSVFGQLLRDYRANLRLSQEELAARAFVSRRTIAALESSPHQVPRRDTVALLADALHLSGGARERFAAAARGGPASGPFELLRPQPLPRPLTSFVGRERELATLAAWLCGSPARPLVTITGTGGVGKTRLAVELAHRLAGSEIGCIWPVLLGAVGDPAHVDQAVAQALGLGASAAPRREILIDALRARGGLLLLDNCEHLLSSAADLVRALLAAVPGLRVLATSRRALGVAGETSLGLAPLGLPAPAAAVAAVSASDAARLLIDRAAPGWAVTGDNAAAVAALCRRLDGLPLALELAAPRLATLGPAAILARLGGEGGLLASGDPSVPERHRTLAAVLDWSHDLLSPGERALFRRLAAFAGGGSLAALEAVCAGGDPALAPGEVAALLAGLVEQSLVVAEARPGGESRYRLLATARSYADARLAAAGEAGAVRARHCAWFTALAERVTYPLDGGEAAEAWLRELDADAENLRAALDWAIARDPGAGLRLIGAAWPYLLLCGRHDEARAWLDRGLARTPDAPPARRAAALHGRGYLTIFDHLPTARAALAEALALAEAAGDGDRLVAVRWLYAFACLTGGDAAAAEAQVAAGRAAAGVGPRRRLTPYRMMDGFLALERGEVAAGRALLIAADAAAVAAGQPFYRCPILARLGMAHLQAGAVDEALASLGALDRVAGELGSWFFRYVGRQRLAMVREWAGDLDGAEADYAAAVELAAILGGDPRLVRARALLAQGRLALRRDEPDAALGPLEACAAVLAELGHSLLLEQLDYALGLALWRSGRPASGAPRLRAALARHPDRSPELATRLEGVAGLAAREGAAELAARWIGAAEALRAAGPLRPLVEREGYAATRDAIAGVLGEAGLVAAIRAGRALAAGEATASARAWLAGW